MERYHPLYNSDLLQLISEYVDELRPFQRVHPTWAYAVRTHCCWHKRKRIKHPAHVEIFVSHLALLQWGFEELLFMRYNYDAMFGTCVQQGNQQCIQWMIDRSWNPLQTRASWYAAKHGNLELLKWTQSQNPPGVLSENTSMIAAAGGHVNILQWLHAHGCPWNQDVMYVAAAGGHMSVFEWVNFQTPLRTLRSGVPPLGFVHSKERIYGIAAERGHFQVLQWCLSQDPSVRHCPDICASAAAGGHLNILQWLRSQQYAWDEETCTNAAREGTLEVLQWARSQNPPCPWNDRRMCIAAIEGGRLNVLEWILDNGCHMVAATTMWRLAKRCGYAHIANWIETHYAHLL